MGILARVRKRIFDVVGSGAALVVTSPLLAAAAAASRVEVGPPPFERVLRAGRSGAPFAMWQLRTHPRTELGAWLRGTGVAAWPALWNVLRGEMSLVGPRPVHPQFAGIAPARATVKPGLTGWAQLHGGVRRSWDEEQSLDTWYLEHQSLVIDVMIALRSVVDRVRRPTATDAAMAAVDVDHATGGPSATAN